MISSKANLLAFDAVVPYIASPPVSGANPPILITSGSFFSVAAAGFSLFPPHDVSNNESPNKATVNFFIIVSPLISLFLI